MCLLLFAIIGVRAAEPGNPPEASQVTSKITEVTVYADRARITRAATIEVGPGTLRFAFPKLPGWIDEGSVRVSLSPATAGEVVDVQVEKTFLARPDDEEIRKAEAAVTETGDELAGLDDEAAVLEAESKQVESIRAFSLDKLPRDTAVREVKVEEYGGMVKFVGNTMLEIAKTRRELDRKRRDLQPELRARQQRLADLRQRAQLEQRTVIVTVKGAQATPAGLALNYMTPGTTWEPVHELRAAADGGSAALASYAIVSQTTGEDWDGAKVTFSTQRPNATARIPELEAMLVGGGPSLARVLAPEGDTFQMAQANFDAQNPLWNSYSNVRQVDVLQSWGANVTAQKQRQVMAVETFKKIEQRGTTAQFPALAMQTVRSDGRTVRVPIGSARFETKPRIVAVPELSLNAVQTAELVNTGGQPLLSGKVLLYAEGAFVGTTETEFVAPGESFSLFLGVADRLKLARTLDQKRSSVTWTGKRKRMLASFVVAAENLADKPAAFQLADRIPVSETDEIRVIGVKLLPETKPDVKGLVKWEVTLAAREKKEFRIEYTLDYPADLPVVRDTAVNGAVRGAATAPSAAPEMNAPATERFYRQIGDLEQRIKK